MFTCNDINLLTFTYYLKYILILNIIIIPFMYLYFNLVIIIKRKLIITKWYLKKKLKPTFYIFIVFCLSLIIHNMLQTGNNVCYMSATPNIYNQYKKSYYFLEDKNIDSDVKTNYLNNILTNKNNSSLTNIIYKEANIIKNDEIKEEKNKKQENIIVNDNFLHENNLKVQNGIYIIDGIFYYPSTYSGMNCSNNPESNGYNNPYGYNNYFYTRLSKLIEEANRNGYKITMSGEGCRTYNTQVYYYNTMERGRAITPGYSLHGFGIASDLEFYNLDGSICSGYRTDNSCPSMGWAHANAYKYGLTFPLLNASYREDWHIEPISKIKY